MSEATKAQQRMASAIVDANTDSLRKPLTYAETLVLILEHSEAASISGRELIELLDDYAAKVRGRMLMDIPANANAELEARQRLLAWTEEELSNFRKLASQPQPAPTEHLIRAMATSPQGTPNPEPNPFEPDETEAQQNARVGRMIRENADRRMVEDLPDKCSDCDEAAKHAYSDATTPGFFSPKCERHSTVAAQTCQQASKTPESSSRTDGIAPTHVEQAGSNSAAQKEKDNA